MLELRVSAVGIPPIKNQFIVSGTKVALWPHTQKAAQAKIFKTARASQTV